MASNTVPTPKLPSNPPTDDHSEIGVKVETHALNGHSGSFEGVSFFLRIAIPQVHLNATPFTSTWSAGALKKLGMTAIGLHGFPI